MPSLMGPYLPEVAAQAFYFDIRDDHPHLLARLAFENNTGVLPYDAMTAVTADQPL